MKRAAKAWTPLKTKNNKHSVVVEFICPGVNVLHSAILGGAQEAEPARSDRYMEHSFCRGNGSLGTRILFHQGRLTCRSSIRVMFSSSTGRSPGLPIEPPAEPLWHRRSAWSAQWARPVDPNDRKIGITWVNQYRYVL